MINHSHKNQLQDNSNHKRSKLDDSEQILSAPQVLEIQKELEQEAARLFPGKFDRCTWDNGYINQQLYVCMTCYLRAYNGNEKRNPQFPLPLGPELAGQVLPAAVCYSCSISCHSDHQLIELMNKRHFRCDCGTLSRFPNHLCRLSSNKPHVNEENNYDLSKQNYFGVFCYCKSSYDPDNESREMFQCTNCEDWFHGSCIGTIPENNSFYEFVCRTCSGPLCSLLKNNVNESVGCDHLLKDCLVIDSGDVFLQDNWRENLRSCPKCESNALLNDELKTLLQDPEELYEPEQDEERNISLYDAAYKALESMDRVMALEGIYAINSLTEKLQEFLKPFAESGAIVTKNDILGFFQRLYDSRKPRFD